MKYDDFIELARKRRTIRKFTSKEVTREEVCKIIEAGRLAPSSFNSQPWEYVVVQDEALRLEIVRYLQAAMQGKTTEEVEVNMSVTFATAPTFIILYGDPRVRPFGPPHLIADDILWDFNLATTMATSFQQMHLAATSLDLGAMWVSASHKAGVDEKIRALLGIPKDLVLFELMAVGHPDQVANEKNLRNIEEITHWNMCGETDFRTKEEVAKYFKKS
ncbi:MAG: nitroreductase family protein [Sedimentibacter sp.]